MGGMQRAGLFASAVLMVVVLTARGGAVVRNKLCQALSRIFATAHRGVLLRQ